MEPKRRGRPPRKLVEYENEGVNIVSHLEEEKHPATNEQPRRGRGRPRKRPVDFDE